jgi:hypothetical protein
MGKAHQAWSAASYAKTYNAFRSQIEARSTG